MRAKFYFENGITNVWQEPAVRGTERLKDQYKPLHSNQKPLKLMNLCIRSSSDVGDVVWEPFGGLCSAAIASHQLKRKCYASEIHSDYFKVAIERLSNYDIQQELALYEDSCQA